MNSVSANFPTSITVFPYKITLLASHTLPRASQTLQSTTVNNESNAPMQINAGAQQFTVDPYTVKTIPHVAVDHVDVIVTQPAGAFNGGQIYASATDQALPSSSSTVAQPTLTEFTYVQSGKITLPAGASDVVLVTQTIGNSVDALHFTVQMLLKHLTINGSVPADNLITLYAKNARSGAASSGIGFGGGSVDEDYSDPVPLYITNFTTAPASSSGTGGSELDRVGDSVAVRIASNLGAPADLIYSLVLALR